MKIWEVIAPSGLATKHAAEEIQLDNAGALVGVAFAPFRVLWAYSPSSWARVTKAPGPHED